MWIWRVVWVTVLSVAVVVLMCLAGGVFGWTFGGWLMAQGVPIGVAAPLVATLMASLTFVVAHLFFSWVFWLQ